MTRSAVSHTCRCDIAGALLGIGQLAFDGERALAMIERAFAVVHSLRSLRSLWFDLFVFAAENTESAESCSLSAVTVAAVRLSGDRLGRRLIETVETLSNKTLEPTPGSASGLPGSREFS